MITYCKLCLSVLHVAQVAPAFAHALLPSSAYKRDLCASGCVLHSSGNSSCMTSMGRGRETQLHTRLQLPPGCTKLAFMLLPIMLHTMSMSCRQPITRNIATTTCRGVWEPDDSWPCRVEMPSASKPLDNCHITITRSSQNCQAINNNKMWINGNI